VAAEQEKPASPANGLRAVDVALGLVVAVYGFGTAFLMVTLGLRTPFADQWRQNMPLLQRPFPESVLQPESGHRQVLPNLVRLADLHWFCGSGELLAWTGAALFAAFFALLHRALRPPAGAPPVPRPAAIAAIALGLGWLANGRMLLHPNESVQVGGVLVATLAALFAANAETLTRTRIAVAIACCTAATFCFGTGFAAFAAVGALLVLRRAGRGPLLAVATAAALVMLLYQVLLPRGDRVQASTDCWSLACSANLPRWLAAPWIHAFFGLAADDFQAGIATVVSQHGPHGALLCAAARVVAAPLGPEATRQFAGAVLGLLGLLLLAAAAARTWRRRRETAPLQHLALGLARFSCACGGLVCAARASYFGQFPGQLFAERYLPWSGLFWSGLFLFWGLGTARRAVRAGVAVVALAVVLWPVHRAWLSWSAAFRNLGERGALILRHDVLDPCHGNLPADLAPFTLAECAAAHRAAGVAMFGEAAIPTPGTRLPPPAVAPSVDLPCVPMQRRIGPFGSDAGGDDGLADVGWLHSAQLLPPALLARAEREWPIVDAAGLVVGCARADESHAWLRRLPQPFVSRRGNFYVLEDARARVAWLVEPAPPHRPLAVVARTLPR
jgi:hypothetical protein